MAGKSQEQPNVFYCRITDAVADETFDARVEVVKRPVIRMSRYERRPELADIFIEELVGRLDRWITITERNDRELRIKGTHKHVHGHFVLFDMDGKGKYMRRDRYGNTLEKRLCETWSLGESFGRSIQRTLRYSTG